MVLEKSLESPLDSKEIQPVHPKGKQFWVFNRRTKLKFQYFCHLIWRNDSLEKSLMLGKRLKVEEEVDNRGWDHLIASPTQWTWIWVRSGSWWWTGKPGVLQSMGSQRVRHKWATELNWTELIRLNAILSNHHTLSFSYWIQKSVLYVCISSPVLHVRSLIPSF